MRSARDFAPIFPMTRPRCTFHVPRAQFCCHLLVHQSGRHQSHHFALATTQSLKQSAYPGCRLIASRYMRSRSMPIATASNMSCSRNGFVRKSTAPAFIALADMGVLAYSVMKMMGISRAGEFGLKIEAAHARPSDVEHQTARGMLAKNSIREPNTSACRQRPLGRGSKFVNTRYCRTRNSPGTPGLRLRSV